MRRAGFFIIFMLFMSSSLQADEMLVVQSNEHSESWDKQYYSALTKILGKRHKLHVVKINARELTADALSGRGKEIWAKYQQVKPRHVILADDTAINLLGKQFADEKVSVVFLGANNNPRIRFGSEGYPSNVTGVLERPLIRKSIAHLSQLIPAAKKVLVLFDKSELSDAALDQTRRKSLKIDGVTVDIRQVGSSADWKKSVLDAEEEGYDAVFIGYHDTLKDKNGMVADPDDVIIWTNQNSTVPLFGYRDDDVGQGKTLGGLLVDGYEQGVAAARLLLQAAGGRIPTSITCIRGQLVFSRSELRRWDIELPRSILLQTKLVN